MGESSKSRLVRGARSGDGLLARLARSGNAGDSASSPVSKVGRRLLVALLRSNASRVAGDVPADRKLTALNQWLILRQILCDGCLR